MLRNEVFQQIILLKLLDLMRDEIIKIINFAIPGNVASVQLKEHKQHNFPGIVVLSNVVEHVNPETDDNTWKMECHVEIYNWGILR